MWIFNAVASANPQDISIQQVVKDSETGEELQKFEIPMEEDGSFDLFGGGLFGELFGDHRSLEEKSRMQKMVTRIPWTNCPCCI